MWSWLKRREWPARQEREATEHVVQPPERVVSGKYQLLHKYLEERFANTVVLTFAEVEDLIGSALPDQARSEPEWWASQPYGQAEPVRADRRVRASRVGIVVMAWS